MMQAAGIDLGGTKIEASVFDEHWQAVETKRVPTPNNYEALIEALRDQVQWVENAAGQGIPIGMGTPGRHDFKTGNAFMANVSADGKPLRTDLLAATRRDIVFGNDCDLFAFSEANLGAGKGFRTVFGLILGTGIGGGTCFDGVLHQSLNGTAGEVGHMPISANLVAEFDLPILPCGCGRHGCYETLGAGP
ncbi:MAG: ROK family protein, partial [Rhodobacteraceae bacterium]|nr:ROK family protein [Paracoccaceae bacterium]